MTREEFLEACHQFTTDNPHIALLAVLGETADNGVQCQDSETYIRNATLPQACELVVMLGSTIGNHISGGVFHKGVYDDQSFPNHGTQ